MPDNGIHYEAKEVNKFNDLAHEWWNLEGELRTLHHINPVRLAFVKQYTSLENKSIIDIGCGGGILAESLAAAGGVVTAIDLAPQSIEIAKLHLYESGLAINYECIAIETKATSSESQFDIVTCMEMLEHVPNPQIIIDNCYKLLKPGGWAFFSTLNRSLKSYALGVIAAEYILNLVPKGTHEYKKFIKPSELRRLLSNSGFEVSSISGITYNPLTHKADLCKNVDINYIVGCQKLC